MIRQTYKLGRNFYQLFYQPEITLRELIEGQDKSQIFLLIMTASIPLFLYLICRVIWDLIKYGNVLVIFGTGLNLVLIVEALIFAYLGYFVVKVLRK